MDIAVATADWSAYRCGCKRDASHLPGMLFRLLDPREEGDETIHREIASHVFTAECLHESALPVTRSLLAGLADGVQWDVYSKATLLLLYILSCHVTVDGVDQGYVDACHAEARKAEWLFMRDFRACPPEAAGNIFDIFEVLDEEWWRERLEDSRCPRGGT